ncbi:MAG: capsule assembly Wzi family protein [Gemmatimonadaceae bacterium]
MFIDPTDPVYQDIRLLTESGLIKHAVLGQQPYSRLQVAILVAGAQATLDSSVAASAPTIGAEYRQFLAELLVSIRQRFEIEAISGPGSTRLQIRPLREPIRALASEWTGTDSPWRAVPANNGLGTIDAEINPLLSNRQGRPLVDGSNVLLASEHVFESSNFALSLQPEAYVATTDGRTAKSAAIQQAVGRVLYRNTALDIGRDYVRWGQGADVGLLGSNNAPPLNLIRLSNERLLTLPWIFRYLGPSKFSIFYARLGVEQNFPNPYFVGYKVSIAPTNNLELGADIYSKSGGRGAPPGSLSARIVDLFPFLDASGYANKVGLKGVFEFSDRYAGVDARWRIPGLRGTELYTELLMNDFDVRRLGSVLWQDAGHILGVGLPQLSANGRVRAWLEYHHTGDRYYEHAQFISGQTSKRILIGDPLGPDAHGLYANLDWYQSVFRRYSIQGAVERRSNDQFRYWDVPLPAFGWSRIEERPKEWRSRVLATWRQLPSGAGLGAFGQVGYEKALNFNFVQGDSRNGFLARAGVEVKFH